MSTQPEEEFYEELDDMMEAMPHQPIEVQDDPHAQDDYPHA